MSSDDAHTNPMLHRRSLLTAAGVGIAGAALATAPADANHRPRRGRLADLVVEKDVENVVITERWARDTAHWDVMLEQYHPDSLVEVSWIRTNGPEFVRLSRLGFDAGARSAHVLSPVLINVNGRRATADTGSIIAGRVTLAGVSVFLTAFGRIVERLERRHGVWRISELRVVYQFDYLTPENPQDEIMLDAARAARYRPSYRNLSYWVEETRGAAAVNYDLPGVDRFETVRALYEANNAWLARGRD